MIQDTTIAAGPTDTGTFTYGESARVLRSDDYSRPAFTVGESVRMVTSQGGLRLKIEIFLSDSPARSYAYGSPRFQSLQRTVAAGA